MEKSKKTHWKKVLPFIVSAIFIAVALFFWKRNQQQVIPQKTSIKIGVSTYRVNDTFINTMMDKLEKAAKEYEEQSGIQINLDISSAKDSQRVQNDQIKRFISFDYDVIAVNLVDRTNASVIIDAAMDANIPLIFFNRELVEEDIFRTEEIYYVGTDAKSTAVMEAEIVAEAWERDPDSVDKNGNGAIEYVMLEGEMGHQDAIIRTEWSAQTLVDLGINIQQIASGTANWERSQAAALMEQWISSYGEQIELVLCNNDDMALGAADSLKKLGVEGVTVVGIDATPQGREAVSDGRLLGTVDCNCAAQGKAILDLAVSLALTGEPPSDMPLQNERYIRTELLKITRK